jgi:hypothetical protein
LKSLLATHPLYGIAQLTIGVLMLVWAAAYAYANYQFEDCTALTRSQLEAVQARLDKNKARQDAIKARSAELAKKQKSGN